MKREREGRRIHILILYIVFIKPYRRSSSPISNVPSSGGVSRLVPTGEPLRFTILLFLPFSFRGIQDIYLSEEVEMFIFPLYSFFYSFCISDENFSSPSFTSLSF